MENGAPHSESIDAQKSGVNLPLSSSTTRGTCRCLSAFRLNCKRLNHTVRRSRAEYFWFGEAGIRGDPRANEGWPPSVSVITGTQVASGASNVFQMARAAGCAHAVSLSDRPPDQCRLDRRAVPP